MRKIKIILTILFLSILFGCMPFSSKATYFVEQIKKYSDYNYADTLHFPVFLHNNSSDMNLQNLKDRYKLNEIAGKGSEIEQIENILSWAYSIIEFDGSTPYNGKYNALAIIENCSKDNRGIHCGGKATILIEALQSLDFIARRVVCFSSDLYDYDCHSVVITYSKQYNKWIFLDPSNGVYLTDDNKIPLSIEEIRNSFINDKSVYLNTSARKGEIIFESNLLAYYKKNFVRFQSWIYNGFHYGLPAGFKNSYEDVELRPNNFVDLINDKKDDRAATYYTNNPNLFWAKPE